jgi:hypothetical protein
MDKPAAGVNHTAPGDALRSFIRVLSYNLPNDWFNPAVAQDDVMPLFYRSMLGDGNKPKIGTCGKTLGARLPPAKIFDIPVADNGNVLPKTGGISVAPSLHDLPLHLIPLRLKAQIRYARGNDNLVCWRFGEGPFVEQGVSEKLAFRPDPDKPLKHGFVEPATEMSADEYQRALAATQDQWVRDED